LHSRFLGPKPAGLQFQSFPVWLGDDGWDEFGLDDVQLASPQPNVPWKKKVKIPSFPSPSRQSSDFHEEKF